MKILWAFGLGWMLLGAAAFGAIGCTLSNPARDLKTLFPEMTSYREDVKEMAKLPDGRAAYEASLDKKKFEDVKDFTS